MVSVIVISTSAEQTIEFLNNIVSIKSSDLEEIIVIKIHCCQLDYRSEDIKIKYIDANNVMSFSNLYNVGIKNTAEENDVFLLTDKVKLVDNIFENLKKALYSSEDIGIVTPVSNIGPDYQSLYMAFESFNDYVLYCKDKTIYEDELNEVMLRTCFSVALIKRTLLNKLGGFDGIFNTTELASTDFCIRALKRGYKNLICKHSFIYLEEEYIEYNNMHYINFDKIKFKEKWRFDPDYCFATRGDVVELIKADKSHPIKVLEIGCSCGATLLKVKQVYSNAELYGIEIDESTSEIAKHISKDVKNIDIESDEVIFEDGFFDVILALDVLEHLRDPWKAMQKIKKALKPDGQIIVSLPNIMNISVINNMIKGKWNYEDSGILDRTHLRFFTFDSIYKLFESIGEYYIYYLVIKYTPTEEEETLIELLSSIKDVNSEQLRAYQYIVTNK